MTLPTTMTEDQIERMVERQTDQLDREFMRGDLTQEAYDFRIASIKEWAEDAYAVYCGKVAK